MSNRSPGLHRIVWAAIVAVLVAITVLFGLTLSRKSNLPVISQVGSFTLTNQLSEVVSASDLAGQVWVADIVFTRCAGPCPRMTDEMSKLQQTFAGTPLRFVTLTTDPDYDTPEVLAAYGQKFSAEPDRWWFLTGAKSEIARLAVEGLKLTALEKEENDRLNGADLFIHSTIFVVVDKRGRVRGVFESLEPGFHESIGSAIRALLKES